MKKKGNGTAGIVVTSIFLVLLVALETFICVWLFGADYSAFDEIVREEAPVPGLDDGISPQGLCPLPENEGGYLYAMSGYLGSGPSRIYLIGEETKYVTFSQSGKAVSAHFGGVACAKGKLFVASGKQVISVSLSAALAAEDGAQLPVEGSFTVEGVRSVAYLCYADGVLFAGEFYRPGNYETDESHHLTVNGETNYAVVYGYEETADGFEEAPAFALSVREQVQGMAVAEDGTVALSTSYGLADSRIFFYRDPFAGEPEGTLGDLPLYRLDSADLLCEWQTPCMSEEIFFAGTGAETRLYLLYESRSVKYRYFVRRQIDDILSVRLSDALERGGKE